MKQTKKLLSLVLVLSMILSMFAGLTTTASAAEGDWVAKAVSDIKSNDTVVIVATMSDGTTTYAMSNNNGTSSAPSAIAVTVADGKLTGTVADTIKWNVTYSDGSFTVHPNGQTTALYCTASNNGVRVGTNSNNVFTINATSGYLYNTATKRYLGVYNGSNWRCYTSSSQDNIKGQTFAFYVLETINPDDCAHENKDHFEAKAATCAAEGNIEYWKCKKCGACFKDENGTESIDESLVTIAKLTTHNDVTHHEATESTCSTAGNSEYWECNTCGKLFLDEGCTNETTLADVTLARTGHNFDGETCTGCGGRILAQTTELTPNAKIILTLQDGYKALSADLAATAVDTNDANDKMLLATDSTAVVLTVTGNASGWYFANEEGQYLTVVYSSNKYSLSFAEKDDDNSAWTLSDGSNGGKILQNKGYTNEYLEVYNNKFTAYTKSASAKDTLYEMCFFQVAAGEAQQKYTINVEQPTVGGTIEASATEAAEGEKVTLSYHITDVDYKFGAFTVKTESGVAVEVAEDNTFVMPAENVTVSASFVKKEHITVNFVVNDTTAKSIVAIEGYKASLVGMPEDPEAIGAYEFMGWTTDENVTSADFTKLDGDTVIDLHTPGLVTGEDGSHTLTVRAVFATKTGAGSADTFKLSATDKDGGVHYAGSVTKSYFNSVDNAADAVVFGMEKAEVEGVDNAYYVYYMNGDVKTYLSGTDKLTFVTADKVTETNKPSYFLVETTENGFKLQINNTDGKFFAYNSQTPRFALYLSTYDSGIFELNKAGSSSYGDYTLAPSTDTNKAGNDISLVFNYDADMVVTLKNLIPDVQEDMVQSIGLKIADEDKYDEIVSDNASFMATVENNTIVVSLEKSMISSSLGFTYQVVLTNGLTYTGTIELVSGDEIYYDDASGFFTYDDNWVTDGTHSSIQLPFDENGSDVTDKFNTLEHHAGTVHTATVEAGKNASVSFSFTGTGFELIAATNTLSGAVKIEVTDAKGNTKSYVVDTYYGCTYDGKNWTVNPDAKETVYQSPVARIEGLTYGTYTVKVTAIYSKVFDHTGLESYEFYFDGVRILWPMGEGEFDGINIREGLKSDAPGSVVYIDGASDSGITVNDMGKVGNPNEVMLAKGQAIAFKATASSLTDLRIGARAVTGTRSQLSFYAAGNLTSKMYYINLNSSTEMHYTLPCVDNTEEGREKGLTWTQENDGSYSITVIVKNTGDGICALSDLIPDGAVVTFTEDVQQTAAAFAKRLYANEQTFASLTDVAEGAWYYDAVKTAVEAGIMNGTNNATFVPGNELTRAELVQVLYNVAGKPAVEFTGRFSDVSENAWFASAVEWAAANGITLGNGKGEFNPNGLLTREQMVTFLYRFVGAAAVAEDATASFVDGSTVSNFAAEAMNWAVANGIVNGVGNNTLAPKANATRASIAKIMTVNISLLAK